MIYVYFSAMLIVYAVAHIGTNSKYMPPAVSKFSAFIIFIVLVLVSGFRTGIGDTFFYRHTYNMMVENPNMEANSRDEGFSLFMRFLTGISKDPQLFIFIAAFITNLFIILALYRYSKPFELGIFLYFGTVLFYVTMNGVRQSLVAAILFWAVRYIIKRQWVKYMILVLLLSTFHQSAIIFLPLYFLVKKEAWGKTFWITFGACITIFIAFKPMLGSIVSLLDRTSYSGYGQDMLNETLTVNPIRIFITLVPLVMAYFVKDRLRDKWPESDIFIYMTLFNFIFMLLSSQYLYFYRLCIYFDLFNLVLIPRLLYFYGKQKGLALYVLIIIFYLIFAWYQVDLWHENYTNILFS